MSEGIFGTDVSNLISAVFTQILVVKDVRDSLECFSCRPTIRFSIDAYSMWCLSPASLAEPYMVTRIRLSERPCARGAG